jgi:hypothetical protein
MWQSGWGTQAVTNFLRDRELTAGCMMFGCLKMFEDI